MPSKKKMGRLKSKKRVNLQVEEQRPRPYSHSHNQEDEPSSCSHNQDEAEQGNTMQKSSSSRRLIRRSAQKIGLCPPDPLPIVKRFSEMYERKKRRSLLLKE